MVQVLNGEVWRFHVRCAGADRVFLVREPDIGPSAWIEMSATDRDCWEVTHHLTEGSYRFHYIRANGSTFLNGGDHGLTAERLGPVGSGSMVDSAAYAMTA